MYLVKKLHLIIILFIFVSCINIYKQNKYNLPYQKYSYIDDKISIDISSNYFLSDDDSLDILLKIKNISKINIFVFTEFYISYNLTQKKIIIEYNGLLNNGIETIKTMKILKPNEEYLLRKSLSKNKLIKRNFSKYFTLTLSLGYISNIDNLTSYKNLSNYKIKKIDDKTIKISSIIASALLNRKIFCCLGIFIL